MLQEWNSWRWQTLLLLPPVSVSTLQEDSSVFHTSIYPSFSPSFFPSLHPKLSFLLWICPIVWFVFVINLENKMSFILYGLYICYVCGVQSKQRIMHTPQGSGTPQWYWSPSRTTCDTIPQICSGMWLALKCTRSINDWATGDNILRGFSEGTPGSPLVCYVVEMIDVIHFIYQ